MLSQQYQCQNDLSTILIRHYEVSQVSTGISFIEESIAQKAI